MSELIKFLSSFDTPDDALSAIQEELGIKVKVYDSGLTVFNYSQIDSPKMNPVVRECRGVILRCDRKNNEWYFVCRTFNRFFNYGEAPETLTDFDLTRCVMMEKADGSLIKVYRDKGRWFIGTRGTAYAESENYTGELFCDLVLDSFGFSESEFISYTEDYLPRGMTHMYEFTSPDNRVVTPYTKSEMVYLGSVDNDTGAISSVEQCVFGVCREAEEFDISSMEDCVEASKELKDLQEGYVVRDLQSGQMVKVKSPLYVAAHHLRGDVGLTPKKIAKLVVTNETAEYLKYFPEDTTKVQLVDDQWQVIQGFINNVWLCDKDIESQKEFALAVKDLPYQGVLFRARKESSDPIKVLHSMPESYKMKLLIEWMERTKSNE